MFVNVLKIKPQFLGVIFHGQMKPCIAFVCLQSSNETHEEKNADVKGTRKSEA